MLSARTQRKSQRRTTCPRSHPWPLSDTFNRTLPIQGILQSVLAMAACLYVGVGLTQYSGMKIFIVYYSH